MVPTSALSGGLSGVWGTIAVIISLDDGGHAWFEPLTLRVGGDHDLAIWMLCSRSQSGLELGQGS